MTPLFATRLDALSAWRAALVGQLEALTRFMVQHELADARAIDQAAALRTRLGSDKLVLAFVAEFSRGKSELINAIFFADSGRRVLPAAPGRTTMCPVELAWNPAEPPSLLLLPIETRLECLSLGDLRLQQRAWTTLALDLSDTDRLAAALQEVTRIRHVTREQARLLGFWDDEQPADNPPIDAQGRVEVPAWRHALINYPHPLLAQGLVVLDTPGLNAIGAEPELTLSLLPSAHATLFILGADTGVTRSDMAIWRDHLGSPTQSRFVVLNKIDALRDPLATTAQVEAQIASQCRDTAQLLGVTSDRVFPLSARQGLAARIGRDAAGLADSRLPELERALAEQLLPQRRRMLGDVVTEAARQIEIDVARRLGDDRRQLAEQMLELRGLRGKSGGKLRLMLQRIDAETAEFEDCTTRLQALRTVHARMLRDALQSISTEQLRREVKLMQIEMSTMILRLGARKSFAALCQRLRARLDKASLQSVEIRDMLSGSFARLNAEFGFGLAVSDGPDIAAFMPEFDEIERDYIRYLGLTQSLRLTSATFMAQFRHLLVSRLRVVFESASSKIDVWSRQVSAQVETQLRERRRSYMQRREALERIQVAAGDLESRIAEIEAQDRRLQQFLGRVRAMTQALRDQALAEPAESAGDRDGDDAPESVDLQRAQA